MRISDWSSDVCSSDLIAAFLLRGLAGSPAPDNVPPMQISLTVNGERRDVDVPPSMLLVEVLRDRLGLTGTHLGCDTSSTAERRVGQECVTTCSFRWTPSH